MEDPTVEDSFITPQRICDEAKQEITVELSDKELLKWEKQRAKELAEEESSDDSEDDKKKDEVDGKDDNGAAATGGIDGDNNKEGGEKPDSEMKDTDDKEEDGMFNIDAYSVSSITHKYLLIIIFFVLSTVFFVVQQTWLIGNQRTLILNLCLLTVSERWRTLTVPTTPCLKVPTIPTVTAMLLSHPRSHVLPTYFFSALCARITRNATPTHRWLS